MKKLVTCFLIAVLCCSFFAVTVLANEYEYDDYSRITLSEDYTELYCDGITYVRMPGVLYSFEMDERYHMNRFTLSSAQKEEIADISLWVYEDSWAGVYLSVSFYDGRYIESEYIAEEYLEDYKALQAGDRSTLCVDVHYDYDELVYTHVSALQGEKLLISQDEFWSWDMFSVLAANDDMNLWVETGWLFINPVTEECYFADRYQFGVDNPIDYAYDYSELTMHRVEDPVLTQLITEEYMEYNSIGISFFDDEALGKTVALVVLTLVFGVVPAALMVVSLIGFIKGKGFYRKAFVTLFAACFAELALYIPLLIVVI